MPAASFGSSTSTPGPQVIDLTYDGDDNDTTVASKTGQHAPNIEVVVRSVSRTPFDAPRSAKYRKVMHVVNPRHLPSTIVEPRGQTSSANCTHDKTNGPTTSNRHVDVRAATIPNHQTPALIIPRKRKLYSIPHSSGKRCEESSSSSDSNIGRKYNAVKGHVRQGRSTIAGLLSRVQSSFENPFESEDEEMSTSTRASDSYATTPDHTSAMLAARSLSQKAVDLAVKERKAQTVKTSRLDIRDRSNGAETLSKPTSSVPASAKGSLHEKPSSAHHPTLRDTRDFSLPKPFDTFSNDSLSRQNAKRSFNLPASFNTLRDDILRSWEPQGYQMSQTILSGSFPTPKTPPFVEPLLEPSITASVLDSLSSKSGDIQRSNGDAAGDQPSDTTLNGTTKPPAPVPPAFPNVVSEALAAELPRSSNAQMKAQPRRVIQEEPFEISAEEHERRRRQLQQQPFKLDFPPLETLKQTQDSDSDEGPRLRRRLNVKRYTFTKADFGYYSDDEIPAAVSPTDSETEQGSKISQSKPTGLRALFFESDLGSDEVSLIKPYLSIQERRIFRDELKDSQTARPEELRWNGVRLHVPMSNEELSAIQSSITANANTNFTDGSCLYEFLKSKSAAFLRDISFAAQRHPALRERSRQSIEAFLNDVARGFTASSGLRLRFVTSGNQSLHPSLLHHELGEARNARTVRRTVLDSLQPAISFTGTSGDVGTVAWSPNGHIFAAGSACLVDENSMQYNRGNNLLLGDSDKQVLFELPHHATKREKPATGPNSTDAMYVTQDPRLFETVSMLDFSPDGNYLYSVGYDNFLRAYNTSQQSSVEHIWSYNHGAKVDLLAVSSGDQQLLATGCQIIDMALNIFRRTENGMERLISLMSDKANLHTDRHILPSAIKWGKHPSFRHHLLAGFSSTSGNKESGEVCMYDVTRREPIQMIPASGNVFDCAWSPSSWFCAAACTAVSHQINRRTKSQVFIYRPDQAAFKSHGISLESSAIDINDIVFCPYDYNYVAAGATDGRVYVWDIRKPDYLLHLFSHGTPLLELDGSVGREHVDTGVRFCAWSYDCTRLFSGSSDGVVKAWDIHRNPEDAHIQDVVTLNSGVMSGAFNSDFTRLLLGEVNGSITVLEAGHESRSIKETNSFQLQQADDTKSFATSVPTEILDSDSGVTLGRALRKSRQIKFKPLGSLPVRQAVQGRKYRGPYDLAPDSEKLRADATRFQARMKPIDKQNICKIPLCREINNFVTQEEAGDSGRSTDRIPQAIRDAVAQEHPDQRAMIPGMLKCSHCGRPARPRIGDTDQELFPLCERCGFECFRCGRRGKIDVLLSVVKCRDCGLQWRMGALGYNLTKQPRSSGIRRWKRITTRTDLISGNGDGLEDMGDLLRLVEDYYQSLWEDKPLADI